MSHRMVCDGCERSHTHAQRARSAGWACWVSLDIVRKELHLCGACLVLAVRLVREHHAVPKVSR